VLDWQVIFKKICHIFNSNRVNIRPDFYKTFWAEILISLKFVYGSIVSALKFWLPVKYPLLRSVLMFHYSVCIVLKYQRCFIAYLTNTSGLNTFHYSVCSCIEIPKMFYCLSYKHKWREQVEARDHHTCGIMKAGVSASLILQ